MSALPARTAFVLLSCAVFLLLPCRDRELLPTLTPALGQLRGINEIGLTYNLLTSLPDELANLHQLEIIWLNVNLFTEIPLVRCAATKRPLSALLRWLTVTAASLRSLVVQVLTRIPSVTRIMITGNQITTLPAELLNLPRLSGLDLENTKFAAIPPVLVQLLARGSLEAVRVTNIPVMEPLGSTLKERCEALSPLTQSRCHLEGKTTDTCSCGVKCAATQPEGTIVLQANSTGSISTQLVTRPYAFHWPLRVG